MSGEEQGKESPEIILCLVKYFVLYFPATVILPHISILKDNQNLISKNKVMKESIKNTMLYWWYSCKGFMKINYITMVKISALKLVPMYFGLGLHIFICLVFSEKSNQPKIFLYRIFFMPLYMPDLKFLIWKLNVSRTKIPCCYWHFVFLAFLNSEIPRNQTTISRIFFLYWELKSTEDAQWWLTHVRDRRSGKYYSLCFHW